MELYKKLDLDLLNEYRNICLDLLNDNNIDNLKDIKNMLINRVVCNKYNYVNKLSNIDFRLFIINIKNCFDVICSNEKNDLVYNCRNDYFVKKVNGFYKFVNK